MQLKQVRSQITSVISVYHEAQQFLTWTANYRHDVVTHVQYRATKATSARKKLCQMQRVPSSLSMTRFAHWQPHRRLNDDVNDCSFMQLT